ncbi:MAG: patatin-like protein, partial [Gemmatimonadota bacterium]|nr:patatin-like protein [Gemmatimonadota bacterium]
VDVDASSVERSAPDTGADDRNDFVRENNAFLAFAARCTSAFPFAFEPMELVDIEQVPDPEGLKKRWGRFFPDYQPGSRSNSSASATLPPTAYDFHNRPFADGGYLDNKPFGHALDALVARRASIPVERKLVYVEPSPEHPEDRTAQLTRPNAIENVSLALSLAREERIRDEVQRVLARNRLIERIERIVTGSEAAVRKRAASVAQAAPNPTASSTTSDPALAPPGAPSTAPADQELAHTLAAAAANYALEDVDAGIQTYGVAYAGYHRLKVGAVSDDLATAIARLANFDDDSDERLALRYLVRAWRNLTYIDPDAADRSVENRSADGSVQPTTLEGGPTVAPTRTQNAFLLAYDLTYRIRRADFVLGKIDALHCLDGEAAVMFSKSGLGPIPSDPAARAAIRAFLGELGTQLSGAYAALRAGRDEITTRPAESGVSVEIALLRDAVQRTGITRETLREVLQPASEPARNHAAERVVRARWAAFSRLAESLAERMEVASVRARSLALAALAPRAVQSESTSLRADDTPSASQLSPAVREGLRAVIRDYYLQYNFYDVIAFPILFSTEVGEELDAVDIVRISPEDAKSLIDERASGRRKLAGTALGHFGAFMQRSWRVNDILWGRLDGAERLIGTALAHVDDRQTLGADLIAQAHRGVLREDVRAPDRAAMWDLVVGALQATPSVSSVKPDAGASTTVGRADHLSESARDAAVERMAAADDQRQRARQSFMRTESLRQFFATQYTVDRRLDRRIALDALSRSTRVVGAILQRTATEAASSTQAALPAHLGTVVARLGAVLWGIVQVGVPGGLAGTFADRAIQVLYAFEVLLILVGLLLGGGTTGLGVMLLVLTFATHFAVSTTRDYLAYRAWPRWKVAVVASLPAVMILFLGIGVTTVTMLVRDPKPLCAWASRHGQLGRLVPSSCLAAAVPRSGAGS